MLAGTPEGKAAILIRELKAVALESYRNGQRAGAPKTQKRQAVIAAPAKRNYKR